MVNIKLSKQQNMWFMYSWWQVLETKIQGLLHWIDLKSQNRPKMPPFHAFKYNNFDRGK
jgi:hypothetical protein